MILALSVIFASLAGITLAGLGGWLVALGGNPAYCLLGIALLIFAWLLARRQPIALHLYAIILLLTLVWAVVEVGLDWWQLVPRGWLLVVFGLWLWLPPVRRALFGREPRPSLQAIAPLTLAILATIGTGVYAMFNDPHIIAGRIAPDRLVASPNLGADFPDGD